MESQEEIKFDNYRKSIDLHTLKLLDSKGISLQRYNRVYIMSDDDDVRAFEYAFVNADELYRAFDGERIIAVFEDKGHIDVMVVAYFQGEGPFVETWRIKYF